MVLNHKLIFLSNRLKFDNTFRLQVNYFCSRLLDSAVAILLLVVTGRKRWYNMVFILLIVKAAT